MKAMVSKLRDGSIVLEIRGKSKEEKEWFDQVDNRIRKQEKLTGRIDSGFNFRDTILTIKVPPPADPNNDIT